MSSILTEYTPSQALKSLKDVKKTKLYEMMKDGELSYKARGINGRIIDGSELARVFGDQFRPLSEEEEGKASNVQEIEETDVGERIRIAAEQAKLLTENQALKERLQDKDSEIRYLRDQIEKSSEERRKILSLLPTPHSEQSDQITPSKTRGWLSRIFRA